MPRNVIFYIKERLDCSGLRLLYNFIMKENIRQIRCFSILGFRSSY